MEVLKVVAEGPTTSFRYPHFMQGVQPTFEMPPPATIYGHICSALGEWFDPKGIRFALHFRFAARFDDIEHTHVLARSTGRLPGTTVAQVLKGTTNPFRRSILFRPVLTLYVNQPSWVQCFQSPRFPVALGRSQDLFSYTSVQRLRLEQASSAYFEHTLAPYSFARRTVHGVVVLMPRFLDYHRGRHPVFGRYVVIHRRVHSRDFLRIAGEPELRFWIDPASPADEDAHLGLAFHSWIGQDESDLGLA